MEYREIIEAIGRESGGLSREAVGARARRDMAGTASMAPDLDGRQYPRLRRKGASFPDIGHPAVLGP
jgi:hypothetical protein